MSETKKRKLIIHYHLFKNAGTSVDHILKNNFGKYWYGQEFPNVNSRPGNVKLVENWIERHKDAQVLSSHTATLQLPNLKNVFVYPIVFIRHPIVRLLSAYNFERKQDVDTFGANLAKRVDFADYLRERMSSDHDYSCQNFQSIRIGRIVAENDQDTTGRALHALEVLPFFGVVELFDVSIRLMENWLRPNFPEFTVFSTQKNTTSQGDATLEERLNKIRVMLGDHFYEKVWKENKSDIELYTVASKRILSAEVLLKKDND